MKKSFLKNILLPLAVLSIIFLSLSSCQRGYGCPYKMQAHIEAKK
jgi:hypothetical protein